MIYGQGSGENCEEMLCIKERQKWAIEKPKLDNARRLRGIYFIDPEDKEFKETIKIAREKLETPMAPAVPCKTSKNSQHGTTRGKTKGSSGKNGSPKDFEYDDVTIGKALSSPLFTQEREDDVSRRRAHHSQDEGLSSSQSLSVSHYRTGRPVVKPLDSQIPNVRQSQLRKWENQDSFGTTKRANSR